MNYNIRELKPSEYSLLKDFTYHAIFQRDPNNLLSKDILNNPELEVFYEDFGKPDDFGLIATHENQAIGAVWARILDVKGFGHIHNKTPEFAISILPQYRGNKIGTRLMHCMIELLRSNGYEKASLAVQKDNYAVKMYLDVGFKHVKELDEEYLMVIDLK